MLAGACLAASVVPGQPWAAVFAWLCAFEFFAFFWPSPFWVLPTLTLSASEAAVAIGFVNICANIAGLLGSPLIGEMRNVGFGDRACMLVLAGCYVAGGVVVAMLPSPAGSRPRSSRRTWRDGGPPDRDGHRRGPCFARSHRRIMVSSSISTARSS